jgi:hypothetical protein
MREVMIGLRAWAVRERPTACAEGKTVNMVVNDHFLFDLVEVNPGQVVLAVGGEVGVVVVVSLSELVDKMLGVFDGLR